jgi:signal transduction histidine kinase
MTSRLEAQDQVRRQLMADIAHELRTPLTIIQGRLEGLLDGVYPRDNGQLEGILGDTRVLARLVEDLRTLAHAESGTLALHKEPTDAASVIADAVQACRPDANARDVALGHDAGAALPMIEVDPVRLREVLMNLLTNAIRHTPAGGQVAVSASALDGQVQLRVTDTGSGIAPDELPRIFERFYKGRSSAGSGLGLPIARGIVEAHGGTITADSTPGRGTSVTVTLPIA